MAPPFVARLSTTAPFVSHVSHTGDGLGCDWVLAGGPRLRHRQHSLVGDLGAPDWPSDHCLLRVALARRALARAPLHRASRRSRQ